MKRKFQALVIVLVVMPGWNLQAQEPVYQETWEINNLTHVASYPATFTGNPEVVTTDLGKAVRFDGEGDMLLVKANPLGEAKEFTIEVIFKPEGIYPVNKDPRFVHIQDPDDPINKRVMIELRTTPGNLFYLDGFLLTDSDNLALIDSTLVHQSHMWHHAAVSYKEGVLRTYMDGKEELSGPVAFDESILGKSGLTCLGARMDERNWFKGLILKLKVTHKALDPSEFLSTRREDQLNNN